MNNGEADIERCVEQLCQQGCDKVYEYIDALRSGRQLPEIGPLTAAGRRAVLEELLSIMAVYESGTR
jgi:hypothetical protein